jgi:hypothetical protein
MRRSLMFLLLAWASVHASSNPYAPRADVTNVTSMGANPMAMELAKATVPDAKTVGVPAYAGSEIVRINQILQVRDRKLQEVNVVILYTKDTLDKVIAYYRAANPDWAWNKLGESQPYPVRGAATENLPESTTHVMSGPFVALTGIDGAAYPRADDTGLFLEMAPGSRTGIKIEYPGTIHSLIDVDEGVINQAMLQCIPHEALQEAQEAWDRTEPAMRELTQAHYMNNICNRTAQTCTRLPYEVECQEFLRRYAG